MIVEHNDDDVIYERKQNERLMIIINWKTNIRSNGLNKYESK